MLYTIDISDKKNPKVVSEKKVFDKPTRYCGSVIGPDGRRYFSSMSNGDISKFDVSDPKDAKLMDSGKILYQSSTGAVAGEPANGRFYIIDTKKMKVTDTVVLGATYDVHDVATTPDGGYAIVAARKVPPNEMKDSEYVVYNMKTKKAIGSVSLCKGCHKAMGVDPEAKKEREVFVCGIQIAWDK